MTYDPTAVAATYDRLASRWSEWTGAVSPPLTMTYLADLMTRLSPAGQVLELGCGTGLPVAAELVSAGFAYRGVDLSPAMVAAARRNAASGDFQVADMTELERPPASLEAVIAFHSIVHVPRGNHASLYRRIFGWLRPGGWFVLSLGASSDPASTEPDWLGAGPMFWSSYDAEVSLRLLAEAGFETISSQVHDQMEPEDVPVRFLWVVARRPSSKETRAGGPFPG